jgi:hypothetical protein
MTATAIGSAADTPCLVLMFKAPDRSKRRLAAQGCAAATQIAARLLDCAVEDLRGWPGRVCFAPADAAAAAALHDASADFVVDQGDGNLGQRIGHVNCGLAAHGVDAQIFIGSDCPGLGPAYLEAAASALRRADVVLGPAEDGGVVLMGINGRWPPLDDLPWSEPQLHEALLNACTARGLGCATLPTLVDVDSVTDLDRIGDVLGADARPARRALLELIGAPAAAGGGASL